MPKNPQPEELLKLSKFDPTDQSVVDSYLEKASAMGCSLEFKEGMIYELEKEAKDLENSLLSKLRLDLEKMAMELGAACPYSPEQIARFTSSKEEFEKAASIEAQLVWTGIEDTLRKEGAGEEFLEGMKKEAGNALIDLWNLGRVAARRPGTALKALQSLPQAGAEAASMARSNKGLGAVLNTAGEALKPTDTTPKILKMLNPMNWGRPNFGGDIAGSKRHQFAAKMKELSAPTGTPGGTFSRGALTPHEENLLGKVQQSGLEEMAAGHRQNTADAIQQAYHNNLRAATSPVRSPEALAAQARVRAAGKGNFTPIMEQLNVPKATAKSFGSAKGSARVNAGVEDTLDAAKAHATEAGKARFNKAKVPEYNMSPSASGSPQGAFRFDPGRGARWAGMGALGGSAFGIPGAVVGGLGGGLMGTLGAGGGTAALGLGGLYAGKQMLNATGLTGKNPDYDITGAPMDRHRAVGAFNNKFTGGAGGALIGALIANHMGLQGPYSWMLPLMGGALGYQHFPNMMNRMKDPYGYGMNSVGQGAASYNRSTPFGQPTQ